MHIIPDMKDVPRLNDECRQHDTKEFPTTFRTAALSGCEYMMVTGVSALGQEPLDKSLAMRCIGRETDGFARSKCCLVSLVNVRVGPAEPQLGLKFSFPEPFYLPARELTAALDNIVDLC